MRTGRPLTHAARPYRLRALLAEHGVHAFELREVMRLRTLYGDQPMSSSALSRVLVHQQWPATCDRDACMAAVLDVLRRQGVPEEQLKTAWETDGQADPHAFPESPKPARVSRLPATAETDPFNLPEHTMLSPEVRMHFGLSADPFHNDVRGPDDIFVAADQRYVRESMYYTARHQGFLAVVGESGSGKSTLRRDLLARIKRDGERIIVIRPGGDRETAELRAAHVCEAIVGEVSTERMKSSLEARSRQMQRLLSASASAGYTHVVLIEEAQDLCKPTLKYLKRLWETEDGFTRLLGVLLIGQPELGDMLNERKNYDLREVIRRCEVATLRPLDRMLADYLEFKFKRVGKALPEVFDDGAIDALRQRLTRTNQMTKETESQVYPMAVQNAVAAAMTRTAALGLPRITADLVAKL